MGCKASKPGNEIVVSSIDRNRAVRRDETYQLVSELRSLGVASGPLPALLMPDESSLAGTPELKKAISKNPELLSLINDHLNAIIKTLRLVTGVKGHVDKAQDILSAIRGALECFEEENAKRRNDKKKKKKKKKSTNKYSEAVDKLRAVGDPFAELNTGELRQACALLRLLLAALRRRHQEIEKRRRSVKKWRKVWNWIYMSGIVAVLACSVVLGAVVSPAASAGATAGAAAMKAVEPFINSMWDRCEGSLQEEKDVIEEMLKMAELAVHGLENVRLTFEKFKIDFGAVLEGVGFAISGEEEEEEEKETAVKMGIEHIMANKGEVEKGYDSLKEKLDLFVGEIRNTASKFLNIITKDISVLT